MNENQHKNIRAILIEELGQLSYFEKKNIEEKIDEQFFKKQIFLIQNQKRQAAIFAVCWGVLAVTYLIFFSLNPVNSLSLSPLKWMSSLFMLLCSFLFAIGWGVTNSTLKKRKLIYRLLLEMRE